MCIFRPFHGHVYSVLHHHHSSPVFSKCELYHKRGSFDVYEVETKKKKLLKVGLSSVLSITGLKIFTLDGSFNLIPCINLIFVVEVNIICWCMSIF